MENLDALYQRLDGLDRDIQAEAVSTAPKCHWEAK
jgi:hypothetical protein